MRIVLCLALIIVCVFPNTGLAGWYNMEGESVPDSLDRKSIDGFGAFLLLTDEEEDVFRRWNIPSLVFDVNKTETIEKGKTITSLIFFSGCEEDAKGNCSIVANYKIWQPDGKLYGDIPDTEVWMNKPRPPGKTLGLTVQYIKIRIEPNDQLGKYIVDAEVTDLNKKVKLSLRSSFKAIESSR